MHTKYFESVVLVIAVFAVTLAANAVEYSPFDALGITTGMGLQAADDSLKKQGWQVKTESAFQIGSTGIKYVQARRYEKGAETFDIAYALPPSEPSVMSITRSTPVSSSGSLVTLDTLRKGLTDRYGPYQHEHIAAFGGSFQWFAGSDPERCAKASSSGGFLVRRRGGTATVPNCNGFYLKVSFRLQNRNIGPVVTLMSQHIVDVDELSESSLRFEAYSAEVIAASEAERTKGAKVPDF